MGKFAAFKIPLKGMPEGTQEFEYELGTDFFRNMESADVLNGSVKVTLGVKRNGDIYELYFTFGGMIHIPCDRCLDEMEHTIDTTYHLSVKYGDEYNDESDDVLIIPESDNYLNVAYMMYDTVVLTIPLKHVHPAGKCNKGMSEQLKRHTAQNINDEDYNTADDDAAGMPLDNEDVEMPDAETGNETENNFGCDPRWDALKKLKDNN